MKIKYCPVCKTELIWDDEFDVWDCPECDVYINEHGLIEDKGELAKYDMLYDLDHKDD